MTIELNGLVIGGTEWETKPFNFSDILKIGGGGDTPSWQDIVLSDNGSLTLTNAKANGLNYLKLFGDCEQTGTPTPDNPIDIVCNNGAIKYSANISNVNEQTALIGYYISSSGVVTADQFNWIYQEYIPVQPNTTYTLSFNISAYYVTISEYTTASDSGFVIRKAGQTGNNTKLTITTGSTTNFVRFGTNIDRTEVTLDRVLGIEWMLNKGSVAISYTPYVEGGIYTDGTTETVEVSFCDNSIDGQGTFVSPSASTTTRIYKVFGKLQAGHYKIKTSSDFQFIFQYKDTPDQSYTQYGNIGTWTNEEEFDITDTSMYYGIAIRNASASGNIYPSTFYNADGKISLNLVNNNATAEMLLGVGNYQDEQSVINGHITKNVRVIVLDGTEAWSKRNDTGVNRYQANILTNKASGAIACLCSHFQNVTSFANLNDNCFIADATTRIIFDEEDITTLSDWKVWLANQYANGTPVIVIYQLATPTTETVTGQHLHIQAGTNIVEITQASIDNLGLEISYKGTV